jgi:spore coat polysaccharide biosynthesis protein SpsF
MKIRQANNKGTDLNLIYSLSNDSLVRANSFNQNKIEYEEHCNWFEKTLIDKNTLFFLVFVDETEAEFIGQIRFKRESENSNECVISLSITEQFRGKHIAKEFLELGIIELQKNWKNIYTIIAEVKDENIASNKLFEKEGFKLVSRVNTYKLITCSACVCGGGAVYKT